MVRSFSVQLIEEKFSSKYFLDAGHKNKTNLNFDNFIEHNQSGMNLFIGR